MIALNHAFLAGIARAPLAQALPALELIEHVRRRTRELPRVHEELSMFETGEGPFLVWANRHKSDPTLGPLVRLLLSSVTGPFLPADRFEGAVEPPLDPLAEWLADLVRRLLAGPRAAGALSGLLSPAPAGGADSPAFRGADRVVSNWLDASAFDGELTASSDGRGTLEVLLAAEREMDGQLIVLPSARRSAEGWALDCRTAELHKALLGLEVYAAALREGLPRGQCAARYYERTTIPMSEESAATWKNPTRRRQRMFVAASYGEQYFDMHAKPGNLTRVHVWTPPAEARVGVTPVFVGHCGQHLD